MILRTLAGCFTVILFLSSCRKEMTGSGLPAGDEITKPQARSSLAATAASQNWYGLYRYYTEDPIDPDWQGDTLPVYDLIKNGTASFNNNASLPAVTGSSINYHIPQSQLVSGDSIVFEARIKSVSNALGLTMYDDEKGFYASLFIDPPANGKRTYTIAVDSYKSASVTPVLNFNSYRLVQFVLKESTAFVYVDNKLVMKAPYDKTYQPKKITRLIMFNWNGKVECDKVRLLNSFTKKIRMKEDFNGNGQSNTVFY